MNNRNIYKREMQTWPTLQDYGKWLTLEKSGIQLFYYEVGDFSQKTILMVHGLGDEADTWRHVFLPLSQKYHIIAVDLPGFGRSEKPKRNYSPEFMNSTIMEFLDIKQVERTILMGSSLGGIYSHWIGLVYPGRISGLILVGGALYNTKSLKGGLNLMRIPILGEFIYTRLRKNPDAAYETLRQVYYNLDSMPKDDRDFLYQRVNERVWNNGQRRAYFSTLRNMISWVSGQQKGLALKLKELRTPTLIVRGEHDPLFSEEAAEKIITLQPYATRVTIKGSGHLPHQETPKEFLKEISPWLDEKY